MLRLLTLASLWLTAITVQAQFAPETDPLRGVYVDDFLKMDATGSNVDSTHSILSVDRNHDGIFEKEDALLQYACKHHITYLAIYDMHRILGRNRVAWNENSHQYENLEKHLCRFITKAKADYGIKQIGAIGGSPNFFDSLSTFMDRYPLSAPVHLDSTITNSPYFDQSLRLAEQTFTQNTKEAKQAEVIKFGLDVMNFNAANSCSASIDVLNVELEFWGDCANEFQNFYDICVSMNSLKQIYNQNHPNHQLITEAYLAFLYYCNTNPNTGMVTKTIDGCRSCSPYPGTTNPHPALIDRVLLSFLQQNPYSFVWGDQSYFEDALTSDSTDLHPIFYAESQKLGGSFDFFGTWFTQSPVYNMYIAENYYFYHFLNYSGSHLGTPQQNDIQAGGIQWFSSRYLVDHHHPVMLQTNGPFCSTGGLTDIILFFRGPAESGTDYIFYIIDDSNGQIVYPYNGIPKTGTSVSTISNPGFACINFADTNLFPPIQLPTGNYTAHLDLNYEHSQGCSNSVTCPVIVQSQPKILLAGDSSFCEGNTTFLMAPSGFSYNWYHNGEMVYNQHSNILPVSADGDYYCDVTSGSCTGISNTIHITVHPMPNATLSSHCNGNGTITIRADLTNYTTNPTIYNGTGGVTYLWETGETTDQITIPVPTGGTETYHVTIFDPYSGCSIERSHRVPVNPDSLTASIYVLTNPSSPCSADGVIGAELLPASSVLGACDYLWSNGSTDHEISGLPPGVYTVTISQLKNACSSQATITLGTLPSNPPSIAPVISAAGCRNSNDGSISLNISGGNPPFSFSWDGIPDESNYNSHAQSQTDLFPGIYTLHVVDAGHCQYDFTYTVPSTSGKPNISISSVTATGACLSATGAATVSSSGGVSPYQYLWNDPSSQTGATAHNLTAGSYDVVVTDAAGCTGSATVHIPSSAAAISTQLLPASQTEITCNGVNDGKIVVRINGGTEPYQVNSPWILQNDTASLLNAAPGNYTLIITDNTSCTHSVSFTIMNAALDFSVADSSTLCTGCPNGSFYISNLTGQPPYTVTISPNAGTVSGAYITGLLAGPYSICVTDAQNCQLCKTDTILDGPLGVRNLSAGSLHIYPNPASNAITISSPLLNGNNCTVRLMMANGQLIRCWQTAEIRTLSLKTDFLAPGIYFLQLSDKDNNSQMGKVIIK